MLSFVFQKMRSKKWLIASLLIGNILLMAVASASSMYVNAVMQRALTKELNAYMTEKNVYPGTISAKLPLYGYTSADKANLKAVRTVEKAVQDMVADIGTPVLEMTTTYDFGTAKMHQKSETGQNDQPVSLSAYANLGLHVKFTEGQIYSAEVKDNVIEVITNGQTMFSCNYMLGDILEQETLKDPEGVPYRFKIVGVYDAKDAQDPYWASFGPLWNKVFMMDPAVFENVIIAPEGEGYRCSAEYRAVMDYEELRASDSLHTLNVLSSNSRWMTKELGVTQFSANFQGVMSTFYDEAVTMEVTIWALQTPVFVMLAAFVFMVSRQMLELEQNEISVFKSRGAAKRQIISIYLLQSVIVALIGMVAGVPLGMLICRFIGSANAFLEFVSRSGMRVEVGHEALEYAGIAAAFSICTMVIPVFKYANVGIVDHKRKKTRRSKNPWWQTAFLDVILLGCSLYLLYMYSGMKDELVMKVMKGDGLDPLLYLSSALFMMSAGLVVYRLLPLLIKLIFFIGKKFWSPSLYASFLRILRSQDNQGFLVVFLVITVAMGIFNTQTARTINANGEEQHRYSVGADLVVQEKWYTAKDRVDYQYLLKNEPDKTTPTFTEPDFAKYMSLSEAESVTKVLVERKAAVANMPKGKLSKNVTVMGINTDEFGRTVWFKDDLLSAHINEFLNTIAPNATSVLVSSNFRDLHGFQLGDQIQFENFWGDRVVGTIYGFVDYWPGYTPVNRYIDEDGSVKQDNNFLIVGHLSFLQSKWGVTPYEVWIDAKDSTAFFYDFAAKNYLKYYDIQDASEQIVNMKNDPMFQGTNGIMTIGFIIVLLLCSVGFLIYWILSIQSRTMQFGIFRAMGMSLREILSMLINEQVFISGAAIGSGVLVGKLTSDMFIPLLQIAYSSSDRAIPLEIISQTSDNIRLAVVIGSMIVICMIVLVGLISKIRIAQALKLGED